MADALPRATLTRASQERTRLELARAKNAAGAEQAEPTGPIDIDSGALNVPFLRNRVLRMANEGKLNLQDTQIPAGQLAETGREQGRLAAMQRAYQLGSGRKQAYPPEGGPGAGDAAAVDQAVGRESREQRASSMLGRLKSAALGPARAVSSRGNGQQGPQPQSRSILNPTLGFGTKGKEGPKKPEEVMTTMMMGGFIRGCWAALWETFGHTIYIIDILFLAQAGSKYLRKYIPGVGEEWIPPQLLKHIPKTALLPLKLGEIVGLCVITFLTFILDLLLLSIIAILVGIAYSF